MNTRRRWLAAGAAWPALAWTGALHAQVKPPVAIGWLSADSRDDSTAELNAFKEGMASLGWKLGVMYLLEERYADGLVERLPALAQELAAKNPAVIVAMPSAAVRAAGRAAPTTPVVRSSGDSPLTGLVESLARPGGMVTGVSSFSDDVSLKVIELLVEAMPKLRLAPAAVGMARVLPATCSTGGRSRNYRQFNFNLDLNIHTFVVILRACATASIPPNARAI